MDTRTKIVPFESLIALARDSESNPRASASGLPAPVPPEAVMPDQANWIVVPGLFDPMTAIQARRLGQYAQGKNLAVVVIDQPGTLLDAPSRAVLVAALRIVAAVSIASPNAWRNASFACETVPYDEAAERQMTSEFVALVARQRP